MCLPRSSGSKGGGRQLSKGNSHARQAAHVLNSGQRLSLCSLSLLLTCIVACLCLLMLCVACCVRGSIIMIMILIIIMIIVIVIVIVVIIVT